MNENAVVDGFISVRVHDSIPVILIAQAAASIGCILQADGNGMKIVKREVKKRGRRSHKDINFEAPKHD